MGKAITDSVRFARLMGVYLNNVSLDGVSDDLVEWALQHPQEAGAQFSAFLKNGGQMTSVPQQFTVWKTITVAPKSAHVYLAELDRARIQVSTFAQNIMLRSGFKTLTGSRTIRVAKATLSELGFTELPTTDQIWARIVQLGGELLPAEAGPVIRMDHTDQEKGTAFWVAMKQITDSCTNQRVFYISRDDDGRLCFIAHFASPNGQWSLYNEFAFGLRE